MKIAVNTRLLIKDQMDGIGWFTYESFRHVVADHPNDEFIFIFDRQPHHDFIFADNVKIEIIGPQARHAMLYKVWYQYALPRLLKKISPDVFVGTDGMIPLKTPIKTLSVIHDLNFEYYPEHLPKILARYYIKYFKKFAEKATRIATVSEYSKQDIVKVYHISNEKIDVVYNGANENFRPISDENRIHIQKKYAKGFPYFLFVGTLHPRKNLIHLFKAFDLFKTNTKSDLKLLIVGRKMWWTKEMQHTFHQLSHHHDIIFTGRVSDKELYELTAGAFAMTYVPVFEGFGIPLVEAMSCGTPVVTSNVTSMPEVVGDAGILVDPFSVDEIAQAMVNMVNNNSLRQELIEKSIIQAHQFSWKRTADLLWDSIIKTIDA